jgi:hypothetical protein
VISEPSSSSLSSSSSLDAASSSFDIRRLVRAVSGTCL